MIINTYRWLLCPCITATSRLFFRAGYGYRVKTIGQQATVREAPILVFSPHSSFLDAFVAHWTGLPSLIIRSEDRKLPLFGQLINYTQPVYVWREDPNSRQNTIKEIQRRVHLNPTNEDDRWQQILIFPEGTCTNRKSLITFKPGAFIPGVPVQPVCIRYPNRLDTVSWTWQGPGALDLIWLTLTQFYTYCELEFLPVYVPSEAEKKDPQLYADNVRDVMAKALNVPVTDYSYEDCRLMTKAQKLGLPADIGLIGVQKIRNEFGLPVKVVEDDFLKSFAQLADPASGTASSGRLASYLHLPVSHPKVVQLLAMYDQDRSGVITFKNYAKGRCSLSAIGDRDNNRTTVALSWNKVRTSLRLEVEELEDIDAFVAHLMKADANENGVLERLYEAIPEWRWIVSGLTV